MVVEEEEEEEEEGKEEDESLSSSSSSSSELLRPSMRSQLQGTPADTRPDTASSPGEGAGSKVVIEGDGVADAAGDGVPTPSCGSTVPPPAPLSCFSLSSSTPSLLTGAGPGVAVGIVGSSPSPLP